MLNRPRTISERLAEATKITFVERRTERALISKAVKATEPPFVVAFINGAGGIGKSRLLQAALGKHGSEVRRFILDCREIELPLRVFRQRLAGNWKYRILSPILQP